MELKVTTIEGKEAVERAFKHVADKAADASTVAAELARIGVDAARSAAPVGATGELVAALKAAGLVVETVEPVRIPIENGQAGVPALRLAVVDNVWTG